mmetsp:Transcript_20484/g.53276  ORF Transcript_20484/g.53276 Transcript_20484/m.53276 type:complete len:321 (-) Transcript_20484:869-1831(-)
MPRVDVRGGRTVLPANRAGVIRQRLLLRRRRMGRGDLHTAQPTGKQHPNADPPGAWSGPGGDDRLVGHRQRHRGVGAVWCGGLRVGGPYQCRRGRRPSLGARRRPVHSRGHHGQPDRGRGVRVCRRRRGQSVQLYVPPRASVRSGEQAHHLWRHGERTRVLAVPGVQRCCGVRCGHVCHKPHGRWADRRDRCRHVPASRRLCVQFRQRRRCARGPVHGEYRASGGAGAVYGVSRQPRGQWLQLGALHRTLPGHAFERCAGHVHVGQRRGHQHAVLLVGCRAGALHRHFNRAMVWGGRPRRERGKPRQVAFGRPRRCQRQS